MSTAIKTPSKAARCGSIDFWRIVFTLMIVICHASDIFPYMPDVFPTNGRPMRGAYIAVEFFGIVSGYLMVASARKQERRNENMDLGTETICFMKRKIGKIYPYFFVSVIISFVLRQLFDKSSVRQVLSRAVKSIWELLLIRMSGINGYYNVGSAWYLSAMFIIMLAAYPLLRKMGNVFTHIIAPLTAILCMGHMSMVVKSACANTPPLSGAWGMIRITMDISIGCICYVICEAITKVSLASWPRPVLGVIEAFCFICVIVGAMFKSVTQWDFIWILFFAVGITISFSGKSSLSTILQAKWVEKINTWCVPVYLNHQIWLALLVPRFSEGGVWEHWSIFTRCAIYSVLFILTSGVDKITTERLFWPAWRKFKNLIFA